MLFWYFDMKEQCMWVPGVSFSSLLFLYIYFDCLSVCLCPINVKTAEPIRPKFFLGSGMTPGKVYEWSKIKNFVLKRFLFCKILKMCEKSLWNPQIFLFILYKDQMLPDKASIKSLIRRWPQTPKIPSF